jgi:hypothetical protein|nr:hypothetical protein [Halogeometricum sp. S3BR5-2]
MEGVADQCHGTKEETTSEFDHEADNIDQGDASQFPDAPFAITMTVSAIVALSSSQAKSPIYVFCIN